MANLFDLLMQPDELPRWALRPEWHRQAACRGVGPDAFFPGLASGRSDLSLVGDIDDPVVMSSDDFLGFVGLYWFAAFLVNGLMFNKAAANKGLDTWGLSLVGVLFPFIGWPYLIARPSFLEEWDT